MAETRSNTAALLPWGPGAVVPLPAWLAAALGELARGGAAWRPLDPLAPTVALVPSERRAEAEARLVPAGLTLAARDVRLGAAPAAGVKPPAGAVDAWRPDAAVRLLLEAHGGASRLLEAALGAARAETGDASEVLERALEEPCLLAAGDLLETTAADGPASRRLARFHGARGDASRLGDLVRLLRSDEATCGVTPLARALLGAACWSALRGDLPFDAAVEERLAALLLEEPASGREGGPIPGPLDPPAPLEPSVAARDLADRLRRLAVAAGDVKVGPTSALPGEGLARRLADLAALRDGASAASLEAAERLGASLDDDGVLALVLADARSSLPPPLRRRRARRLLAGRDPAPFLQLAPELGGLDALVRAAAGAPPAEREQRLALVHARLVELAAEEPRLLGPEVAAARTALGGARGAELLDLALASAEGAPDVAQRAGRLVEAWVDAPEPGPLAALGPALDALARASRAGLAPLAGALDAARFDPAAAGPRALEVLCHVHARRRLLGAEPPATLVDRLVARGDEGPSLAPVAREVDAAAVARLLGAALPRALALELAGALGGDAPRLVHPRDASRWDAVRGGAAAVATIEEEEELPLASAPALLAAARAVHPPVPLELPDAALPPEATGLGPGRWALLAPRVAGARVAPTEAGLLEVARALARVHEAGLALGDDPLAAARRDEQGRLGFAAGDVRALLDPDRLADAQARDVARLAAHAAAIVGPARGQPPGGDAAALGLWLEPLADAAPDRGLLSPDEDVAAALEDGLRAAGAATPAEARAWLPPALASLLGEAEVRDAMLGLALDAWADGRTPGGAGATPAFDDAGRLLWDGHP